MATPLDPHSRQFSHINGSLRELTDRLAVAELCKGWPVYRDASEWMNFRSLFTDDAQVWTTWSGALSIDGFIEVSKQGKSAGAFIQHRECGTLVDLNPETGRAVGKMKATITQRFVEQGTGIEYDVDCDCRFLFFCQRESSSEALSSSPGKPSNRNSPLGGRVWKTKYVKLVYEKDKVIPVDGVNVPRFSAEALGKFPEGYRYLGAAQELLGYQIDLQLATLKDQATWNQMYAGMEKWLAGKDADLFW